MQKIAVIGAGITGASIAWHLAGQGAEVTVIDQGLPAQGASGSSFGWINASFYLSPDHHRLRAAGMAAHRRLADTFPGLHRFPGCLWWEEQGEGLARTEAALRDQGYAVTRLTRAEVAAREPALSRPPAEALAFPGEGCVEAPDLIPRLLTHDRIRLLTGLPASMATMSGRIAGVETPLGRIPADQVVIAAGIGSPALLAPFGLTLPMLHRPGAILRTRPVALRLSHILAAPEREIRQDAQGRLVVPTAAGHQGDSGAALASPATMEAETLAQLTALFDLPGLRAESLSHALRPVPGDGLPALGPVPQVPGLWLATLHSGITLAPVVGELLAREMMGGEEQMLLAPFRPSRLVT